jgi:hypothetical protein
MIFLNHEEEPVVTINKDMVLDYKQTGDDCLVGIKRELSKQLVYYILYTDLQEVNASFGTIIEKLLDNKYLDVRDLDKDIAKLDKNCKALLKSCDGFVEEYVIENVKIWVDRLLLCVSKLKYILDKFCTDNSEGVFRNEVRPVF